jgi:hypothetical protein
VADTQATAQSTVPDSAVKSAPSGPATTSGVRAPLSAPRANQQGSTGSSSASSTGAKASARAALDRVKAALSDVDAVSAAGNGEALLRDITRLLPRLSSRADSVEATYYAVETNLILDRPAEACRLLSRIRAASRGTEFEGLVDKLANDTELACATRR